MLKFKLHLDWNSFQSSSFTFIEFSKFQIYSIQTFHKFLFNPDIPSNSDLSSNFYVKIFFSQKIFSPVNCVLNFKFFNENGKNS